MATSRRTSTFLKKKAAEKPAVRDARKTEPRVWHYRPLRLPYRPVHFTVEQIEEAVDKLTV